MERSDAEVAAGVGRGAVVVEDKLHPRIAEVALAVEKDDGAGIGGVEDGRDGEERLLVLERPSGVKTEEDAVGRWGYCDGYRRR